MTTEPGIHPPDYRLPATAHIGRARLAVSNLDRSLAFYCQIIGLALLQRSENFARLGVHGDTRVLLELQELPGVQPLGKSTRLGLYHTAFLLPSRTALSSFVRHLARHNVHFGAGDHLYSEALYLTDPDGLSVEVYADRDRAGWLMEDRDAGREIVSATEPVRFANLPIVAENSWDGMPAGSTVGHVHLYIGDLQAGRDFYHAALGLDIVTWRYPGALFLSAGGYHHHVGINAWTQDSPIASEHDARLLFWELALPDEAEKQKFIASMTKAGYAQREDASGRVVFVDPWGIQVAPVAVC